jgi:hypothetical protein
MLKNTQIANIALTLNFLPNVASVGVIPSLTKPSKSEILIATLWESEYLKVASFLDWSHLIRLIKPVQQPCTHDVGFAYCYDLLAPFVVDKVVGFNDASRQIRFNRYGTTLYVDEEVSVVHVKKVAEPYIFEGRTVGFENLLSAYLAYAIGISVKSKGLEALGQGVAMAQIGAKRAESNNHSSLRHLERTYLKGV